MSVKGDAADKVVSQLESKLKTAGVALRCCDIVPCIVLAVVRMHCIEGQTWGWAVRSAFHMS